MKSMQRQQGVTAIGWLLIIILAVSIVLFFIRLVPMYIEGYNVKAVVEGLAEDPDLRGKPSSAIHRSLMKRLDINMVTSVEPDDIYISREKDHYLVDVEFEVRRNLVGNLDLVAYFNYTSQVPLK